MIVRLNKPIELEGQFYYTGVGGIMSAGAEMTPEQTMVN